MSEREPYALDATLRMDPEAEIGAPGAAITIELCGSIEHEPPCPLAPHHTGAVRTGDSVRLRVLFAVEPEREAEVRDRIERALRGGEWTLLELSPSAVTLAESDHGERLTRS